MPTVPKLPQVRNEPAVQALQTGAGSGDARAFGFGRGGEAFGQAVQQAGDIAGNIALEMQERDDAVSRASIFSARSEAGSQELLSLTTSADLSDERVVQGFVKSLKDADEQAIAAHEGSGRSRAQLAVRLSQQRGALIDQAIGLSAKAKAERMTFTLGQQVNKAAATVRQDPSTLVQAFQQIEDDLADMGPALTPEMERNHRQVAQGEIAYAAIEGLIDRGAVNQAEQLLLDTPGLEAVYTPSQRKALYDRMRQARASMQAVEKSVKGIPLSIFQNQTPEDQRALLGLDGAGSDGTATERLMQKFADQAPLLANNKLTPTQERRLIADVTNYVQPRTFNDPVTGMVTTTQPRLPGYMVDALHARGYKVPLSAIPGLEAPKPRQQAMPQVTVPQEQPAADAAGQPGEAEQPAASPDQSVSGSMAGSEQEVAPQAIGAANAPSPEMAAANQPDPNAQPELQPTEVAEDVTVQEVAANPVMEGLNPALFKGGKTIAEMGNEFTGPESAIRNLVGSIPFFGTGGGESTSARQALPIVFKRLVKALQTNPRYAGTERESIENDLSVEPRLWDNSTAFLERMVGIDQALERLEQDSLTALGSKISLDQRKHELNTLQSITAFRRVLMPPRLETPQLEQEFERENPHGTRVLVKRGNSWVFGRVDKSQPPQAQQ